ncbi:MAG: DUF362 domain-containing protein [Candidatus Heimdallarchaeota archaeon]
MNKNLNLVSIAKFDGDIAKTLKNAVDLIGGLSLSNILILIKPNLCAEIDISGGATTDLRLIRALVDEILREKGNSGIRIVESNSEAKYIEKAFNNLGYRQLEEGYQANGYDVSLVNLSKVPTKAVSLDGLYFKKVKLPKILLGPRLFISVAKAKTHELTQITGVLKNQFGCLPEKDKTVYHRHIDKVIVDLNRIIRPDLNIVDGVVGMEGVYKGRLKKLGVLMCGHDPVSVDATLAKVMGFNPLKIKHIVLAERYKLGSTRPTITGEKIESVAIKFRKPKLGTAYKIYLRLPEPISQVIKGAYRKFVRGYS